VLLEDQLPARGVNLHILTGICAGLHRPDGATIAEKMLLMVAAMARSWNATWSASGLWTGCVPRRLRAAAAAAWPPSAMTFWPSPAPAASGASQ